MSISAPSPPAMPAASCHGHVSLQHTEYLFNRGLNGFQRLRLTRDEARVVFTQAQHNTLIVKDGETDQLHPWWKRALYKNDVWPSGPGSRYRLRGWPLSKINSISSLFLVCVCLYLSLSLSLSLSLQDVPTRLDTETQLLQTFRSNPTGPL